MSKCVKCGNEILTGDIHWEMGLCNNCYNELYKDHKTHISLDKMWLKLAQDFRDENEKLQDKVADLEAKLAESEHRNEQLVDALNGKVFINYKLPMENAQLKQQLEESEKKFIVANNLRKNSDEVLLNYKTKKYGLDKTIQELRKMKLSLPQKEWFYKGFENCERQMSSHIADLTLEVKQLKQQLAEKDKEIEKYRNMNMIVVGGRNQSKKHFMQVKIKELQNQKAIEQLEKVLALIHNAVNIDSPEYDLVGLYDAVSNQIKQLKEMK